MYIENETIFFYSNISTCEFIGFSSKLTLLYYKTSFLSWLNIEIYLDNTLLETMAYTSGYCNYSLSMSDFICTTLHYWLKVWFVIFLSFQTKPLVRLQPDLDSETGGRILTCYLLPQQITDDNDGMLQRKLCWISTYLVILSIILCC